MTHIWPGLGVAPAPTALSMICKPEAVVTVFPAVCAVAKVGMQANEPATNVAAMAETIDILARRKRRIL